jgi:type IV pilus assembly protein PilC
MPQIFRYKARNLSGRLISGKVRCETPGGVTALLREKNCFAVDIQPDRSVNINIKKIFDVRIDIKSMAVLCRQFSVMLEAGIPLLRCLGTLKVQTENKRLSKILEEVIVCVEKGMDLSNAFNMHRVCLPEIFINMVAAGEAGGNLDQVMSHLTTQFEKEHRTREKIKSAMTYPLLVAVMVFVSVAALMVFVVPVFAGVFDAMGAELPLATRIVIGSSSTLAKYWYLFLLAAAVLLLVLKLFSAKNGSSMDLTRMILKLPLLGRLARQTIIARFTRTLATLLMSGISLVHALEIVEDASGSCLVAYEIRQARISLSEGGKLASALGKSALFPPMVVQMITVGEESGGISSILERLAVFYEEETESLYSSFSSLIEPFMIAFMGLMVAFIALSIYLPLFGMADVMQVGTGAAGGM